VVIRLTLILFTSTAPHSLTDELSAQGHQVYEALVVSEVLALAAQFPVAQIIITADVESERAKVIQHHYPTMTLKSEATITDILWELNQNATIIQ
jgi:hypothetical protein